MDKYLWTIRDALDGAAGWIAHRPAAVQQLNIGADISIVLSSVLLFCAFLSRARSSRAGNPSKVLWVIMTLVLIAGMAHVPAAFPVTENRQAFIGLVKPACAVVFFILSVLLLPGVPKMLALRDPDEFQRELVQRRRTELELRQVHAQLEGVIEQRTSELAAKNEEMEQFLNTVSHDLKNPVVTCLGLIGMVREDVHAGRTEPALDSVNRMERSIARMRRLIEDLLNLSRIGRVRFELAHIDTQEMMRAIGDELRPRLEEAHVELLMEEKLPKLVGDIRWLTEVFENLISNAIKYGSDVPQPRIKVGAREYKDEIRVFVSDNGPGIDPAHHAQIFEPFRRLQSNKEGSGMGLAIVMRIAKMHGGRAWIESALGKGATFWVALPNRAGDETNKVQHTIGGATAPALLGGIK